MPASQRRNKDDEKRPRRDRLSKDGRATRKEFNEAQKIANGLGFLNPTSEVNLDNYGTIGGASSGTSSLVDMLRADAGNGQARVNTDASTQVGAENARAESGLRDSKSRNEAILRDAYEKAGLRPADIVRLLDEQKLYSDIAGNQSGDMKELINNMKNNVIDAGREDARLTEALKRMETGLSGLKTPELQALRETSLREMQGRKQSAERSLNDAVARDGMKGGAAFAAKRQLERESFDSANKTEQDLLLKDAEIMDSRLNTYTDTVLDVDTKKKSNVTSAYGLLGDTMTTDEAMRAQKELAAREMYSKSLLSTTEREKLEKERAKLDLTNNESTYAERIANSIQAGAATRASIMNDERSIAEQAAANRNSLAASSQFDLDKINNAQLNAGLDRQMRGEEINVSQRNKQADDRISIISGIVSNQVARKAADESTAIARQALGGDGNDRSRGDGRDRSTRQETALEPSSYDREVQRQIDDARKRRRRR
jgi:hypothetical protein